MKETKLQKEDLSDMVAEHAAKQKVEVLVACELNSSHSHKKYEISAYTRVVYTVVFKLHSNSTYLLCNCLQKRKRASTESGSGSKASKKLKEFKF